MRLEDYFKNLPIFMIILIIILFYLENELTKFSPKVVFNKHCGLSPIFT